jgi:hypothetical protein
MPIVEIKEKNDSPIVDDSLEKSKMDITTDEIHIFYAKVVNSIAGQYHKCKLSKFENECLIGKQVYERISDEDNIRMYFDIDYKCLKIKKLSVEIFHKMN